MRVNKNLNKNNNNFINALMEPFRHGQEVPRGQFFGKLLHLGKAWIQTYSCQSWPSRMGMQNTPTASLHPGYDTK